MWTWEDIARDCLRDAVIATAPPLVVDAFNRVERLLGRDWMLARLHSDVGGPLIASSSVLGIVSTGRQLCALEDVKNADNLITRLRENDRAARSELAAAFLCLGASRQVEIEFAVPVVVNPNGPPKVPDFRLRAPNETWTYVEVTAPETSKLQQATKRTIERLVSYLDLMPMNSSIEVLLRRDPDDEDLAVLDQEIAKLALSGVSARKDLPELALVLANQTAPADVAISDHGESSEPSLISTAAIVDIDGGVAKAAKHIVVQIPFMDDRAELFLRTEAKQLPHDHPGVVMIDLTGVPAPPDKWEALIRRRLQPTIHTRVSAVCLFSAGHISTAQGDAVEFQVKPICNPNARCRAPDWVVENLRNVRL